MRDARQIISVLTILAATNLIAAPVFARVSLESESSLRLANYFADNPTDKTLFPNKTDNGQQLILRQDLGLHLGEYLTLEANAYTMLNGTSSESSVVALFTQGSDERNRASVGERHYLDDTKTDGFLVADRLALHLHTNLLRVSLGRFPINLTVMNVFRPNDLFAPFRGDSFYRKYKPGVDAAEAELGLGQLTRVNVYGVRGYEDGAEIARIGKDKKNRFTYGESSVVGKFSTTIFGIDWSALGGKYGYHDFYGGSMQGEFSERFGYRVEGNWRAHRLYETTGSEYALGLDTRFGDSVMITAEFYENGAGYNKPEKYNDIASDDDPPRSFFGQQYAACGVNVDATALVALKFLAIINLRDSSALYASRIHYSMAEDADISVGTNTSQGQTPSDGRLRSEFGSYPQLLSVETNIYW